MNPTSADGLLYLIKYNPTLLPEVSEHEREYITKKISFYWRAQEVHQCLRCPNLAEWYYVMGTSIGPRWLDLCSKCSYWMRTTMSYGPVKLREP